jgi:uncharacterized protein
LLAESGKMAGSGCHRTKGMTGKTMTSETPTEDLIRYDVMVQEALLGVVRKVLQDAGRFGLPGEHHFYITFRSQAPGVRISARLKEKYPEEMTIVLQHQFWDLIVGDTTFEVGLSFGGVPERLLVPYDALTGFYDPSVQFGLKFTPDEAQADNDAEADVKDSGQNNKAGPENSGATGAPGAIAAIEPRARRKPAPEDDASAVARDEAIAKPARKSRTKAKTDDLAPSEKAIAATPDEAKSTSGAEVVSLEAFRKKK